MVRVRFAAPADVDDIVRLVIATMPFDPQWNYRFPYRLDFPKDHYQNTKLLYEHFLNAANADWRVLVVELSSAGDEDEAPTVAQQVTALGQCSMWGIGGCNGDIQSDAQEGTIVAFSVWNVSYLNKRMLGPSHQPQNRLCQAFLEAAPR